MHFGRKSTLSVAAVVAALLCPSVTRAGNDSPTAADNRLAGTVPDAGYRGDLPPSCDPNNCPRPGHPTQRCDGTDVVLGELYGLVEYAREGTYPDGQSAFSAAAGVCNNGCVRVGWHAPMLTDHPGITLNAYRLADGRLTQIGAHWVKHGYYALGANACGYGCEGTGNGTELWIGCSDTYSAGGNASRTYLGPRSEWNPFAGTWDCVGSHFSGGEPDCIRRHGSDGHGTPDHWTRIRDDDLLTHGAQFFYDGYCVANGDVDVYNNIGYKPVTFTWNGTLWAANSSGPGVPPTYGVILNSDVWGTEHVTVDTSTGQLVVATTSSNNGDGTWHYEYAVYNVNYDRRVRSFRVPVALGAAVTGIGFHSPPLEEASQAPWIATQDAGSLAWELDDSQTPHNAILFGTLYNFWFDVDAPPQATTVSMEPYFAGEAGLLTAAITGPAAGPAACGDFDGDGDVDLDDFGAFAACYNGANNPPAPSCPPGVDADCDADGDVDLDDFSIFAAAYTGSL